MISSQENKLIKLAFRHGPEGVPFYLLAEGLVDEMGCIPFHGIISRGMLDQLRNESDPIPPWEEFGHLIHDQRVADSSGLVFWRRVANGCGALSFAQSAMCVHRYLEQYVSLLEVEGDFACEALNVKEGHTSSVWRVRIDSGPTSSEFAINVARDSIAGIELARSSKAMKLIVESWPEANLAKVIELTEVRLPELPQPVVVTRNEWISDSFEIHRLSAAACATGQLVLVERFLTDDSAPSRIHRIRGRRLTENETEQVNQDIKVFLHRTEQYGVQLEINHGDLVWNGQRAVVIGFQLTAERMDG